MMDSYRRVLRHPGALRFSVAALVARLPISMVGVGIVLLVQAETGSYGVAGTVSAAYVLAQAAAAMLQGRLLDSLGQAVVLSAAVSGFGVALSLMMLSVEQEWPRTLTYVFAALAGASLPQVGASVRARWSHQLHRPHEVQTAFALESVLDEVVFAVGPVLITTLASLWHPVAGLSVALAVGEEETAAYAGQRSTQPPPRGRRRALTHSPMPWSVIGPLAVVSLAQGTVFGAAEVVIIAFADEQRVPAAAGLLLACWAVGSLVAGLVTGAVAWRRPPVFRVRLGMLALTLTMVPTAVVAAVGSVPAMALVMLVGGLAIAPTLIATLSMAEQAAPKDRLTESLSILHTGLTAGVAPGSAIAGFVVDHYSVSAAFLVAVVAGAAGTVAALLTGRTAAPPRQPHPHA